MTASALLRAFDQQAAWCRETAPFTARVVQCSRDWLARDRAAAAAFAAWAEDPVAGAVPLRWAAALHHLALQGLAPWAGLWPPAGTTASDAELDAAIVAAWQDRRAHCDAALARPPQTNEVQRSAALLPALLHITDRTELPLVLLEIGASAGLNLWCERYRYETPAWSWGEPQATPVLRCSWTGPAPAVDAHLQVSRRAGCDAHPVDLTVPGEALRLASFIWPDQPERLARLRSACSAAQAWLAADGVTVESMPAAQFVARELGAPNAGHATVLMHSVVWQYIAADEQQRIRQTIEDAGRRARRDAPLAWLRFEPPRPDVRMQLRCCIWPGGDDRLLAHCHPHGAAVEWLDAAPERPRSAPPY